ncbi:MAG TPA: GTP-binding protein, partial [Accumulibacter sp.]|nr:GTP-binding protein [Accumulibacter sp.]
MRSDRLPHNKIIFSGTVGAGKSTAIASLSDIPPVATEALATDATAQLKKTTTVAMDYG